MNMKSQGKKTAVFHNIVLYTVFVFYLFILFILLFQKRSSFRSVNLILFFTIRSYLFGNSLLLHAFALMNVLGNIVMFIPLGIYITLFHSNKNILVNTIWTILISVAVEIAQFIFSVGATDIDDVILNGFGGFIGIVIYKFLSYLFKEKTRRAVEIIAPIGGCLAFLILILINR